MFVAQDSGSYYRQSVGEYNATTGATVNAQLISGWIAGNAEGIAVSGNDLFLTNNDQGVVGEYDATTGLPISATLITNWGRPHGLAVSGNDLFVSAEGSQGVAKFTTSGVLVNTQLPTQLPAPSGFDGIALFGGDLFVEDTGAGVIGEYDANTGAAVNADLIDLWPAATDNYGLIAVGAAVPEPSTLVVWLLLGTLALGIGWWRKRKAG